MNAVTYKTTGSIFADLGFSGEESENLKVRAQLINMMSKSGHSVEFSA